MARPRQAKKNRSSKPRVKTGTSGRTKAGRKKVNFLGNETIRQNWDRKLTLAQNYEKLGLSVKLKGRAGGIEKKIGTTTDSLSLSRRSLKAGKLIPEEVQVIRDADGNITGVTEPESWRKRNNPLNDLLNDIEDDSDIEMDGAATEAKKTSNPIVAELEAQAAAELEEIEQNKKPRQQSTREEEWIARLVEKYGDDYTGMFRDRKLNPMQQSEGDLKRRIRKWNAKHGG